MEVNSKGFLYCPRCGRKTNVKVIPGMTRLTKFPMYCRLCREEIIIDYK